MKRRNCIRGLLLMGLSAVGIPVLAQDSSEEAPLPPPVQTWKPAGEITPPGPTATQESAPAVPSPMIQLGSFSLDLHGRIQVLGGVVGEDANLMNGDSLNRDGFRIRRARLGASGTLLDDWEFALEMDLIDEDSGGNALLDANLTYRLLDTLWIRAGAGKLPFGRLSLLSTGEMQFIERPAWVNIERATKVSMLDLDRQVGLTVGGEWSLLRVAAGVYNGSPGFTVGDNNDGLLYLVRLGAGQGDMGRGEADFERGGLRWAVGLNGYYNQAPAADIRGAGVDLGLKVAGLSFYAEALWAKSVPVSQPAGTGNTLDEAERWGMVAQAGYLLPVCCKRLELAVRFAAMDDNVHVKNEGDLWELTAGVNAYLMENHIKASLNYVMKKEREGIDLANDALLVMMQLLF